MEEVTAIQGEGRLSDRQMLIVLKNLRLKWGWKSIVPHIRLSMINCKGIFGEYFAAEEVEFQDSNGEIITRPMIYCSRIEEFVETLADLRGVAFQDLVSKVGLDYG